MNRKDIKQKEKNKSSKKEILGKIVVIVLLSAMILASCSTCIYYVMLALS